MDLLNKVKERLNIQNNEYDKKIQGYIDDITDKIKSLCKRKDLPQELDYFVIRYAMNCYLYYKDKDDSNNEKTQVTSASDNGQTVSFKVTETVSKDDVDLDKVIANNLNEISNYAFMGW
jgi:hypothetical protein